MVRFRDIVRSFRGITFRELLLSSLGRMERFVQLVVVMVVSSSCKCTGDTRTRLIEVFGLVVVNGRFDMADRSGYVLMSLAAIVACGRRVSVSQFVRCVVQVVELVLRFGCFRASESRAEGIAVEQERSGKECGRD